MKQIIKREDKFGRLTAIRFDHRKKNRKKYWLFRCDCGNEKVISFDDVRSGHTKSCGCLNIEKRFKHGMTNTKIYRIWIGMKNRCFNKNNINYKNYGGRGITICKEWITFENFYKDMGEVPENKTLDRINNNKNYCKENCKWSTQTEQHNNRRDNRFLTYQGKRQTIAQWAEELNIIDNTLRSRINNKWSIERALTFNI